MKLDAKATIVLGFTVGIFGGIACSQDRPIEAGQPCPCADGFICCEADRTCQTTCDTADDDDRRSLSAEITTLANGSSPLCIAADPTAVFWMNADGSIAAGSTISKQEVRSRTNPPVTKVEHCTIRRSGGGLYVAAAEGDAVYWFSVSSDGATPVVGASYRKIAAINNPVSLAEDGSYLYVLNGTTGEVRRFQKVVSELADAGSDASADASQGDALDAGTSHDDDVLLGASGGGEAYSLVLDGDTLYWFDRLELRRMPKTGGPITTIATLDKSSGHARGLLAADGSLYWIEGERLMTLPIAGGVAHALPFTPIAPASRGSSGARKTSSAGSDTNAAVYAVTSTDRGLLLAHASTVGLLGYQGGAESLVFTYQDSTYNGGTPSLLFDTSRFIWISADKDSIQFRPLLETDLKLP